MSHITIQLSPDLLAKVQSLTDSPERLQGFVISAIEHEVDRCNPGFDRSRAIAQSNFWGNLQELPAQMQAEGIEINPAEIWGDVQFLSK